MPDVPVTGPNEDPSFQAADAGGDTLLNAPHEAELLVYNGDVVAKTLTVTAQLPCRHGFYDDWVVTISPQTQETVRPFESGRFNNSANRVEFAFDNVTGVQIAGRRWSD